MLPPELQRILDAVDACAHDARTLTEGVSPEAMNWQARPGRSWSIAQCLEHLRLTNATYVGHFSPVVEAAARAGGAAFAGLAPTWMGRRFLKDLEPPPRYRVRTFKTLVPESRFDAAAVVRGYLDGLDPFRRMVQTAANVDVNRVTHSNPFFPMLRMRMATVLQVVPAHDRRHLWQARAVRAHARFPTGS